MNATCQHCEKLMRWDSDRGYFYCTCIESSCPPEPVSSWASEFPENKPLYKDSGLWQMRSDDMVAIIVQQGVNESFNDFIGRCVEHE